MGGCSPEMTLLISSSVPLNDASFLQPICCVKEMFPEYYTILQPPSTAGRMEDRSLDSYHLCQRQTQASACFLSENPSNIHTFNHSCCFLTLFIIKVRSPKGTEMTCFSIYAADFCKISTPQRAKSFLR